jgi:hypothetical protein
MSVYVSNQPGGAGLGPTGAFIGLFVGAVLGLGLVPLFCSAGVFSAFAFFGVAEEVHAVSALTSPLRLVPFELRDSPKLA